MLAQESIKNPALGPSLQAKTGVGFLQSFLPSAIGLAFVIGALIFFFVMITGAIAWITSGGDKASLESARGKITSAIIGLVLLLVTFALIGVIENFFGVNILSIDIGPLKIQ